VLGGGSRPIAPLGARLQPSCLTPVPYVAIGPPYRHAEGHWRGPVPGRLPQTSRSEARPWGEKFGIKLDSLPDTLPLEITKTAASEPALHDITTQVWNQLLGDSLVASDRRPAGGPNNAVK
jgi:hypothetical protein